MPESVRMDQTKLGFGTPMLEWWRKPLKDLALEILNQEFMNPLAFDSKTVANLYRKSLAADYENVMKDFEKHIITASCSDALHKKMHIK